MQNKLKALICMAMIAAGVPVTVCANQDADMMSAAAINNYAVTGSVFEQIALMEQEKVLMQLEKERAALDLDLDRMAAEKIKLHMEIDTLTGRAEEQKKSIEVEKQRLAAESERIAQEQLKLETMQTAPQQMYMPSVDMSQQSQELNNDFSRMYELVGIVGAGRQLEATVSNLNNGQTKKVAVGRYLDGFVVKSISLHDGVVFEKDGVIQVLSPAN